MVPTVPTVPFSLDFKSKNRNQLLLGVPQYYVVARLLKIEQKLASPNFFAPILQLLGSLLLGSYVVEDSVFGLLLGTLAR